MAKKSPTNRFWSVLGALNVLAMVYPVILSRQADSEGAQLVATCVLAVVVFLLAIVDTISIVLAYSL
jgi:hypothetical protein